MDEITAQNVNAVWDFFKNSVSGRTNAMLIPETSV